MILAQKRRQNFNKKFKDIFFSLPKLELKYPKNI